MQYGISELAIIPMRKDPSDQSEMVNQILFGEHFKILESTKKWSKVCLAHDNYKGWICNKQWVKIKTETYENLEKEISSITTDILDIIVKDENQTIVIGSILPSFKSGFSIIEERKYKFNGLTTTGFTKKGKLIETSQVYLNTPYLWGGRSPLGIDCSGFIQIVYRLQGITLPRDANEQSHIGITIESVKDKKVGDLAFFHNSENKITHVGLILEENYIIHASGKVRIDIIDKKGIFNKELNTYTHKLKLIKRIC